MSDCKQYYFAICTYYDNVILDRLVSLSEFTHFIRKLVRLMAAKTWSILDSVRKPGNVVEFTLGNKPKKPGQVVATYTNDKFVEVIGADSLPDYIMTDMQKYLSSISVFRCRCVGLCKYCLKPVGEGSAFSSLGVCKHYSGLASNISAGDITMKNNPKGYKEMNHCKLAVAK